MNKRIIRLFWSNHAAWVWISLCKVPLIIKVLINYIQNLLFTFHIILYTNIFKEQNNFFGFRKSKCISNTRYYSTLNNLDENFLRWFSGFSDAEGNFNITFYKDKSGNITSVTFRFTIELHIDDMDALNTIKERLNLGNKIGVYGNSCKFTITHPKDISKLIEIFDKYKLNTTKYLDYLDFKKAFKLYQEKSDKNDVIFNKLLDIKSRMNSNRTDYTDIKEHEITITDYWLLGLIEGDGSFYLDRVKMEPVFSIVQSNIQSSLIEEIKNYLIQRLNFDRYSLFKLNSASLISVIKGKAEKIVNL